MHEKLIKRLRELASIPEHCENVAACDQCPKEDICLSFTNKRIIEVATQAAADVVDRDEGIRIGAELAAMHGSDATSQDLERAYWTGYEEAMKKRDVRPVVLCRDCVHFQQFRTWDGFCKIDGMLWNNDFFCANGKKEEI